MYDLDAREKEKEEVLRPRLESTDVLNQIHRSNNEVTLGCGRSRRGVWG